MMTRFYSYITLLAAVVMLAACSSEDEMSLQGDEMTVQFTASLDGMLDSRAISDGSQVDVLTFAAFAPDGTEYQSMRRTDVAVVDGRATVTARVVRGQCYRFVFWAQNSTCQAYSFSSDMTKLNVNYDGMKANDETRDAFYAVDVENAATPVTGPFEREVTLRRPFAQVNFGTTAEDLAAANHEAPVTGSMIKIESGVCSQMNLLTGEASAPVAVQLNAGPLPAEKLAVDGEQYEYLSMNYLLANNEQSELTGITMTTVMNHNNVMAGAKVEVPSLPVQRNYRTNVVGRLLTTDVEWTVKIDASFGGENNYDANADRWDGASAKEPYFDEDTHTYEIYSASNLAWFQNNKPADGTTIMLMENSVDFMEKSLSPLFGGAKNITVDGNGNSIRNYAMTAAGNAGLFDGENLTVKNLTIYGAKVKATADGDGNAYAGAIVGKAKGTLTVQNCIVFGSTVEGVNGVGGVLGYANGNVSATNVKVGTSTILNTNAPNAGYVGAFIGLLGAGSHTLTDCEVSNAVVRAYMGGTTLACGKFVGCLNGDVNNLHLVRCTTMAYFEGQNELAQNHTPYSDLIGGVN